LPSRKGTPKLDFLCIIFLYPFLLSRLIIFLISVVGKETLGVGEEKLNDLFTYKKGDEATYFVSEGLGAKS